MNPAVVHRGIEIRTFEEVNGFSVPQSVRGRSAFSYCYVARHRREDDAPILDWGATIEECQREIDALLDD